MEVVLSGAPKSVDAPKSVIAGLDPAIHAAVPLLKLMRASMGQLSMDARVKPAYDEGEMLLEP